MVETLSILIPTYNRCESLRILLSSLEANLARGDFSEIVKIYIADNGSTDGTHALLHEYKKRYPGWSVTVRTSNVGMAKNFFDLISRATGRYFWMVGDDDIFSDAISLDTALKYLETSELDLLILGGPEESDKSKEALGCLRGREFVSSLAKTDPDALRRFTWVSCNIVRKEIFDFRIASTKFSTWYMQMYGIMSGLKRSNGVVVVAPENLVSQGPKRGFRETNFPIGRTIQRHWKNYFYFLAHVFEEPSLRIVGRSYLSGSRFSGNRWRRILRLLR